MSGAHSVSAPKRGGAGASRSGRSHLEANKQDRSRTTFFLAVALFVVVLLGGGASRTDVMSLLYVRPLAAVILVILLFRVRRADLVPVKIPLLLLLGMGGLILLQLIPLPPGLWLSLPGRANFAEAANAIGHDQPWRPLTVTPDLAWSSFLAIVPPLAALLAIGGMNDRDRSLLVPVLICGAVLTMLVAVMQITGGPTSPAYLYNVTHEGSAVGLFANRNHEAAYLAATFPMLRMWTLNPSPSRERARLRIGIAIVLGVVLVPMILVAGSRAGVALAVVGIAGAWLVRQPRFAVREGARRLPRVVVIAGAGMLVAGVALSLYLGRALAVDRLTNAELLESEVRFRNMGLVTKIVGDFFPFGAGFGSFDHVFRIYEPDRWLDPRYFNRAHNDLLELALTGGLPAIALLALFLVWWARKGISLFWVRAKSDSDAYRARGAWIVLLILMMASLVDYPLRTPLMATVFAIAAGWLAVHGNSQDSRQRDQHATNAGIAGL